MSLTFEKWSLNLAHLLCSSCDGGFRVSTSMRLALWIAQLRLCNAYAGWALMHLGADMSSISM